MNRLVVVGSGIAGLAAAWEASQRGAFREVLVLEATPQLGGKLRTSDVELPDGTSLRIDEGADAFLARRPEAMQLCEELGLTDELTSPAVGRAKVFVDGELRFLPARALLGVPLSTDDPEVAAVLGPAGVAELLAADAVDHAPIVGDAAVGPVLRERLGPTAVERLVAPLLGGISAGDVDRMSLRAVAPQLADAAAQGGSLVRAAADQVVRGDGPVFQTPRSGIRRIVQRLLEELAARQVVVRGSSQVLSVGHGADLRVATSAEALQASAVVLATPTKVASHLLHELSPVAAALLAGVEHVSVAFVTLVFDRSDVPGPLDAAGMLVPRSAGTTITAASWGSVKWAHWDDGRHLVVRASVGHDGDERGLTLEDDDLVQAVRTDLHTTMGIRAAPVARRITRWGDAFPQYRPGHQELVAQVTGQLAVDVPALRLAGMAYDGIGIPASIGSGRRAAAELSDLMG
ncbi:MAG: protoporphyrinogen oxidase [Actinomycetes bacterium]